MRDTVDLYHVSGDLIRKFDDQIGAAKARVAADGERAETVALNVKVAWNPDGEILITTEDKGAFNRKSSAIYKPGQIELELTG
jgi:hypothetical protein